jgi:hypothetical protein
MPRRGRVLVAAAAALAIGVLLARRRFNVPDTVEKLADADDPVPSTEAGSLVREFLHDVNASGDDADDVYGQTLARLRERAEPVAEAFADSYRAASRDAYGLRWALVYGAAKLEHPAALTFLREVAGSPVPLEESNDHHFSTAKEESIIRTTAVEGLGRLAVGGEGEAEEGLFEALSHPTFSVRVTAAQALVDGDDSAVMRNRILASLPADEAFVLEIRRVDVRDVSQVDPREHLTPAARRSPSSAAPPPLGQGPGRQRGEIRPSRRSPTVPKERGRG